MVRGIARECEPSHRVQHEGVIQGVPRSGWSEASYWVDTREWSQASHQVQALRDPTITPRWKKINAISADVADIMDITSCDEDITDYDSDSRVWKKIEIL